MAVAALGKLTKLVFKKPHKIFFTTSWLKEFNRVNCFQRSDSI